MIFIYWGIDFSSQHNDPYTLGYYAMTSALSTMILIYLYSFHEWNHNGEDRLHPLIATLDNKYKCIQ